MPLHLTDVKKQYSKDKNLKKEDVEALINWVKKQPHLPEISELQAILFLHSCYYRSEAAKNTIDTYFTMKTRCSDIFKGRNPSVMKKTIDNSLATVLPVKTPEGYTIIFLKLMNFKPENFNFVEHIRYFDMASMLELYQEGTSDGFVIVADMKGAVFGHLTKAMMAGPAVLKKFLFYLQEAMPIRLKALHFFNIVPFMDSILALIKPLMKMDLLDMLYLHNNAEDLAKFVPLECLPEDYGGEVEATSVLHENVKRKYLDNAEFFDWEDGQKVDENKRQGTCKNLDGIFGSEGTFKKLEID